LRHRGGVVKLRLAVLAFLAWPAHSQEPRELPTGLFGVELGSAYQYSVRAHDDAVGTFPVSRLLTEPLSLHRGRDVRFEPLAGKEALPFRAGRSRSAGEPARYSARVYPVIPGDVTTLAELRERNLPQAVTVIEWFRAADELDASERYAWARELCTSLEAELRFAPQQVTNVAESGIYRCVFGSSERELEVTSVVGQTVQLSLADPASDRIEGHVYSTIRRLELRERFEDRSKRR
jgi:hypothetical protein